MYLRIVLVVVGLISFRATAVSYAPTPLPPVNWEASADPRFDPPIEQVVLKIAAHYPPVTDEMLQSFWKAWGIDALDGITALMGNSAWEPFEEALRELFYRCPLAAATPRLTEAITQMAMGMIAAEGDENAQRDVENDLYFAFSRAPAAFLPLLHHEEPRVQRMAAKHVVRRDQRFTPETRAILETFAASEDPIERGYAVELLVLYPSQENAERALAIAATISEEQRKATQERVDLFAPYVRAQEPMQRILDKEKGQS